ncbi:hypothetical protein SAMN02799630_02871 [Paenibacillus sp. UNCCL117]|uniref:hypothetical protein n=1 Tax=unclassified Paenibacillus TaxID=185978 RepID=UPI00088E058D|nr:MULTISPECIES: hypothetical protein [unclassified Paenibacillus]SDD26274.1 hypothetical protein SAMN04488602_10794 [Paenibacillus sp. cl123]SFW41122.1 hypothetical protein SAMN02799630_02871 [Paenibacillus sp. UNCCL117]
MLFLSHSSWKRTWVGAAAILLASASIMSACSKQTPQQGETPPAASTGETGQQPQTPAPTTPGETGQQPQTPAPTTPGGQNGQPPAAGGTQSGTPAAPAEPVKLAALDISDMYKKTVLDLAKAQGLKTAYVPKLGAQDDRVSQIQGMGDSFTIQYLNMELSESAKEMKPAGKVDSEKPVQLKIGSGKWVTEGGKSTLYLKVGDAYLALRSLQKLTAADIEAIAETLAPLE